MSLDELARSATESLRESVDRDVDPVRMLVSVHRTRARRRTARVAVPLVAAALVAAAVWTGIRTERPEPVSPDRVVHSNGALLGGQNARLAPPAGLHLPPLTVSSSPTWSPDGDEVAVLAGGILVTDVRSGAQRRLACPGCTAIAWSPDGQHFAALPRQGSTVDLIDATSGEVAHVRLTGVDGLMSPSWSPDGRSLVFIADAPRDHHGVYVADLDSGKLTEVLTGPAFAVNVSTRPTGAMAASWSARDRIAILEASLPSRPDDPFTLRVVSTSPDGSGTTTLATDGTCACAGFAPVLTWSPNGTTLAVHAQHPGRVSVVDDGTPVRIRFVAGSDYLTWQPR